MQNMLKQIGVPSLISSQEKDIEAADKLILPGVGAFDTCADKLMQSGLIDMLNKKVLQDKTPVLGVCVGLQLLLERSEEGQLPGLGWIKGKVVKFKQNQLPVGTKIPHMGWTDIILRKQSFSKLCSMSLVSISSILITHSF
jgi:glutamine amidotransferase